MNYKNKGFTLVELLAVILIIAIISLILIPFINNIMDDAGKSAYKSSVIGMIDSASNYIGKYVVDNLNNNLSSTIFMCNGTNCTNGYTTLDFSGEVPISGSIIVNGEDDISVKYLSNGKYCAIGKKDSLRIAKKCIYLDTTEPVIKKDLIIKTSSSSIIVTIPLGYSVDEDSDVVKYIISLYKDNELVDEQERTDTSSNITLTFDNLVSSSSYKVLVSAINGNNLKQSVESDIATPNIVNPIFTYVNNPTTAVDNYLKSQSIKVDYDNHNNYKYYFKSTREGNSSIAITSSCGSDTLPINCSSIDSTNHIDANIWYLVDDDTEVSYTQSSTKEDVLYALSYDGTYYSSASTGIISKIDATNPEVSVNVSGKAVMLTMTDNESGIASYCVNTSNTTDGCSWVDISTGNITYTATEARTYYAFVKDNIGNTSNSFSFEIPISAFCEYAIGNTWNYGYTGGVQSFTSPCDANYKLEVWGAQGGTIYITVGGAGTSSCSNRTCGESYNGGGAAITYSGSDYAGVGGGATHIASVSGVLSSLSSNLSSVYIVASGGGGAYYYPYFYSNGGSGGGYIGTSPESGYCYNRTYTVGSVPTQTAGGSSNNCGPSTTSGYFGHGGNANTWAAGGGSGLYGGGAGFAHGGKGGSSYIGNSLLLSKASITKHMTCYYCSTTTSASIYTNSTGNVSGSAISDYAKTGSGYARITLVSY